MDWEEEEERGESMPLFLPRGISNVVVGMITNRGPHQVEGVYDDGTRRDPHSQTDRGQRSSII